MLRDPAMEILVMEPVTPEIEPLAPLNVLCVEVHTLDKTVAQLKNLSKLVNAEGITKKR